MNQFFVSIYPIFSEIYRATVFVYDLIGTFTLAGNILTLTDTYLNGESVSSSPDLFVDIEITKNTMKWGERYDDGYDSGYATYHFRKVK